MFAFHNPSRLQRAGGKSIDYKRGGNDLAIFPMCFLPVTVVQIHSAPKWENHFRALSFPPGSSSCAVPGALAARLFSPAFIPGHKAPQQDPRWQNLVLICKAEWAELAPLPGQRLR